MAAFKVGDRVTWNGYDKYFDNVEMFGVVNEEPSDDWPYYRINRSITGDIWICMESNIELDTRATQPSTALPKIDGSEESYKRWFELVEGSKLRWSGWQESGLPADAYVVPRVLLGDRMQVSLYNHPQYDDGYRFTVDIGSGFERDTDGDMWELAYGLTSANCSTQSEQHECTCNMRDLMMHGCTCGGR